MDGFSSDHCDEVVGQSNDFMTIARESNGRQSEFCFDRQSNMKFDCVFQVHWLIHINGIRDKERKDSSLFRYLKKSKQKKKDSPSSVDIFVFSRLTII